jgi:uncharacterized membrane protein
MKLASCGLIAAFFVFAGVMHFVRPAPFLAIVPGWVPWPGAAVAVSGVFEIAGGLGLLVPRLRRAAGWGLIALLVAVFPANVHMAMNRIPWDGLPVPDALLWLRLPLQAVLIVWVWWATRPAAPAAPGK